MEFLPWTGEISQADFLFLAGLFNSRKDFFSLFLLFLKVIDRGLESGDGWKCGGDFLTDQAGDFAIIANARDVAVTRPSGRAGLE